jgi:hypothetical protein
MSDAATVHSHAHDTGWHAVINRVQAPALVIGVIGFAVAILGLFISPEKAYRSYLWAYIYWSAIPLGSLAFLMIQHMTGGTWGLVMRRFLEASSSLIVLTALFAIPIVIAVVMQRSTLYPWLPHGDVAGQFGHSAPGAEHHLWFKKLWLSQGFWILRSVVYFAIWTGLAFYLNWWSAREDRIGATPKRSFHARVVAAPGLVLYALASTFAFIDWVMSVDPAWYSTMFGVLYLIGQGLVTMAFTILIIRLLANQAPLRDLLTPGLLNDIGNLMFAFLLLWAYTNFSQFLIMWAGNIAEETPYYHYRNTGSWGGVALFLVICHFFAPFLLLLWRRVKRDIRPLAMVALAILIVRSVDLFWVVKPMFSQRETWLVHHIDEPTIEQKQDIKAGKIEHPLAVVEVPGVMENGLFWTDPFAILGMGGIWVGAFCWRLKQLPLIAPNDARLAALAHEHH